MDTAFAHEIKGIVKNLSTLCIGDELNGINHIIIAQGLILYGNKSNRSEYLA